MTRRLLATGKAFYGRDIIPRLFFMTRNTAIKRLFFLFVRGQIIGLHALVFLVEVIVATWRGAGQIRRFTVDRVMTEATVGLCAVCFLFGQGLRMRLMAEQNRPTCPVHFPRFRRGFN